MSIDYKRLHVLRPYSYRDGCMCRLFTVLSLAPILGFYKRKIANGFKWLWSISVKERILRQKPLISKWSIEHCSYEKIPNMDAHWFIDPPYQNLKTTKYRYGRDKIDFSHLAEWCKNRRGFVTACETLIEDNTPFLPTLEPVPWLPFKILKKHTNNNGDRYTELYWTNE